jgi:hypothetical protein
MSGRTPPALALWLLERCGSGSHAESLAGDLIEQYRQGRSLGWLCRQVAMALGVALLRICSALPWMSVARVALRLAAKAAAVLAITAIVEQNRRNPVCGAAVHLGFIATVAALIAVASLAVLAAAALARSIGNQSRNRGRSPIQAFALMAAFGVTALGIGTLTQADTTRSGAAGAGSGAEALRSGVCR